MRFAARDIVRNLKTALPRSEIELVKGDGYWYFIYSAVNDFGTVVLHETHSVPVMYLCDMTKPSWINEGQRFIDRIEEQNAARLVA
jgi:hypothetical protein